MTDTFAIQSVQHALMLVLLLAAPALLVGTIVGLVVSIFQATTQIQDQMITFVPKIIAILLTLLLLVPWFVNMLTRFATECFTRIGTLAG